MASTKMLPILLLLALCYKWTSATEITPNNCDTCEEQLTKYRRFILQAIINFEDVCDSYRPDNNIHDLLHNYQPQERSDIWAFFKLLMAQFNDVEFVNIIHDAVLERCRVKTLSGEKRNSVVLGKKQRFHSWGGKRASQPVIDMDSRLSEEKLPEKQYFI